MSESTTGLTKIDVAALRAADQIQITYPAQPGMPACMALKKIEKTEKQPFAQDACHTVTATSTIDGYSCDVSDARGHEVLSLYRADSCYAGNHAAAVVSTLKVGDELTFVFGVDAHTTGALKDAGFHADCLYLVVRRSGKCVARFELETRITNCRWRMVSGVKEKQDAAQRLITTDEIAA